MKFAKLTDEDIFLVIRQIQFENVPTFALIRRIGHLWYIPYTMLGARLNKFLKNGDPDKNA